MATAPQKISARTAATLPYTGTEELAGVQGGNDRKLTVNGVQRIPASTIALLPAAATAGQGALKYVTDGTSNRGVVVSDGTVWRYLDGTAA